MDSTILTADSYAVAPPEGVALVLTDPPYGVTSLDWDKVDPKRLWDLLASFDAPVVSFGALRLLAAMAEVADRPFYDLVWEKSAPTGFLDAARRPMRVHELIGVYGAKPWNPQRHPARRVSGHAKCRGGKPGVYSGFGEGRDWEDDGTRLDGDVLHAGLGPRDVPRGQRHPTAKPVSLLRLLIRMYTNPGDLVADPFAGSGSTAVACALEGRRSWCCERDAKWADLARRRVRDVESQPKLIEGEEPIDLSRFADA